MRWRRGRRRGREEGGGEEDKGVVERRIRVWWRGG